MFFKGGSIRLPSAFCGGCGLKPSVARLPHSGLSGLHAGMQNIVGCVGPMANCIEDLRLFCEVALAHQPWDYEPSLIEMPWKPASTVNVPKKLTIGLMLHDGIVTPHPPVSRALRQTVNALRAAGHTIVNWDPKHHAALLQWINRAYFLDGAMEYRNTMNPANDPPVPIIHWLLESEGGKRCTLEETWKLNSDIDSLRTLYIDQWRETGIDALLCPANPSVASAHDESRYWGYTSAFNALDLPGVVFPVSTVADDDCWQKDVPVLSEKDQEYRQYYGKDGPSKYRNAPISMQLVGRRLQEEKLLVMAEVVREALKKEREDNHVATDTVSAAKAPTVPIRWAVEEKMTLNAVLRPEEGAIVESLKA